METDRRPFIIPTPAGLVRSVSVLEDVLLYFT